MCRTAGLDDTAMVEIISQGLNPDQAGREVLRRMAERSGIAGGAGYRALHLVTDERDRFRLAAAHGLALRGGLAVTNPAPGHDEIMGRSLEMLAMEALQRANQSTRGTRMEMLGRALTTSDLPNILGNVANVAVLEGWETAAETWSLWCGEGDAANFKPGKAVRLSEMDDLDEIGEEDEYKHAKLSDAAESYQVKTFGKAIRLSRRMLIDDDLGMLISIPRAMGEAASRTVGDVAWAALISNGAMGDGKALFHADHANIATIPAFNVDGVGAALKLLNSQKDMAGKRRIRTPAQFILLPTALEVTAEKFFGSDVIGTAAEPNIRNPYSGTFQSNNRIYEPRLDESSEVVFYLAAAKGRTVVLFWLQGVKVPWIEWKDSWNTDGREGKVRIDVGGKAMDWRGLARVAIG